MNYLYKMKNKLIPIQVLLLAVNILSIRALGTTEKTSTATETASLVPRCIISLGPAVDNNQVIDICRRNNVEFREYDNIKIIDTFGIGPGAARNLALKESRGELIGFTDADCIAEPTWLTNLYGEIQSDEIAGVGGIQFSPHDETRLGKEIHNLFSEIGFISDYMNQKNSVSHTQHNPSCNVIYKKDVLEKIGGFNSELWPGEDNDLDRRLILAGYKLRRTPNAVVYHYRPKTLIQLLKMMISYGSAQAFLVKIYGIFRNIQLIPIFFLPFGLLEILLLKLHSMLFFGINIIIVLLLYLFFLVKSKNFCKSAFHLFLFSITTFGCSVSIKI